VKAYVFDTTYGLFLVDEEGNHIYSIPYPKDPKQVAERIRHLATGTPVEELVRLIEPFKNTYEAFRFERDEVAEAARKALGVNVEVESPSPVGVRFRQQLLDLVVSNKWFPTPAEALRFAHEVASTLSIEQIAREVMRRDVLAIQVVKYIDSLNEIINMLTNRLVEWYGVHFPELYKIVDDRELFTRIVAELGTRDNFTPEKIREIVGSKDKADAILRAADRSVGAPLRKPDTDRIVNTAHLILDLYKERERCADYLDSIMNEVAPNIRELVGTTIGARLIALAGGLDKLARLPSSTIQVLGAEKALFRALRRGGRPPKHGVIFQHPWIHGSPRRIRGRIARTLACKLSIAARLDYFGGEFQGPELRKEVEERVRKLREQYARERLKPTRRRRRRKR